MSNQIRHDHALTVKPSARLSWRRWLTWPHNPCRCCSRRKNKADQRDRRYRLDRDDGHAEQHPALSHADQGAGEDGVINLRAVHPEVLNSGRAPDPSEHRAAGSRCACRWSAWRRQIRPRAPDQRPRWPSQALLRCLTCCIVRYGRVLRASGTLRARPNREKLAWR